MSGCGDEQWGSLNLALVTPQYSSEDEGFGKAVSHMMKVGPVQTGECGERVFNGGIHYDYYNADCRLEEKKRDQARINTRYTQNA